MTARPGPGTASSHGGFTLIEALVAIAILAVVLIQLLATRTSALIDAAEARNWRVARELAERILSEIEAGANDVPPENKTMRDVEDYPGFRYQVLIGEAAISDVEAEIAGEQDYDAPPGGASSANRLEWQQERDRLRRARSSGLSMVDYEEQRRIEELEERIPTETDLEDVAVVVYFPNVRPSETDLEPESTFTLKAKISTMAIQSLTPEQAESVAEARGEGSGGDASTSPLAR